VDRLKQLQNRESQLLCSYMASSAPVLAVRAQISQAQKEVDEEFRSRNQIPVEMTNVVITAGAQEWSLALRTGEAEGAALRAKIEVLKKQMEQAHAQAKNLAKLDERMVQLQRNKELQEENYRYFSKRLEQARVDNALDAAKISSVVVIQPPSYPINKYREKIPQKMGFSIILGLALGLSLAFVRENVVRTSIKSPAEVTTRLGLPLLLSIPFMKLPGRTAHVAHGRVQGDGSVLDKSPILTSRTNPSLQDELRPYCEALRDRIIASTAKADETPYLLGIAGCHPGAGASTVVAGLASAMARNNDGQILIIDAAVDHASAHRLLSQGSPSMMTNLLSDGHGNTIVIQPNLYMLSSCEATDSPAQINMTASITAFTRGLSTSKYRYVIFDLPPVCDISMALRIAPALDGILLVLEAGTGSAAQAIQARDLLNQTGHAALGAILNKTRFFTPAFLGGQS
jgi:Mrp family chromosome partitioning ATPase